ncbi:MAG: hypothetical protein AAF702_49045 [Chloroflexota bacterium]
MANRSSTQLELLLLSFFVLGLAVSLAIAYMDEPVYPERVAVTLVVTPRPKPTETATVDWWSRTKLAEHELAKLPGLPAVSLGGASKSNGYQASQPISFEILSCPAENVRISKILTVNRPGWWNVSGTAAINNFWYWKVELSVDGTAWMVLHSGQSPVTNGLLLEFLTTTVKRGTYQLRLMAVNKQGNYPEPCVVKIRI